MSVRRLVRFLALLSTLLVGAGSGAGQAMPAPQGTRESAASGVSPRVVTVHLGDRILEVTPPVVLRSGRRVADEEVTVSLRNRGTSPLRVTRSDFTLVAQGDVFGAGGWSARGRRIAVAPGHDVTLRLHFAVSASVPGARLSYRPASGPRMSLAVGGPSPSGRLGTRARNANTVNTFYVTQGVGDPWGTAVDASGDVWFADPGCDFAPTCGSSTPPGEIGEIKASSHTVVFYRLPAIMGNQPIFLAFDAAGHLWFTTPNNSMIGEFSPATGTFLGQWPVSGGSGPWDLVIAGGALWYTEHLGAAIGRFDMTAHTHRDFPTPSTNSNPYGLTASGTSIWFTENNSSVDRVGVLNMSTGAISEYPIVLPMSGTPHMIVMGPSGHPWWTEGWSGTIATLNPSAATPGSCGVSTGVCHGITRYALPASTACSGATHVSGITYRSLTNLLWLDNSLTAQVGAFNPVHASFNLTTLSNCNAHPHDGMSLNGAGDVWFNEEFGDAIGELIP